MARGRRRRKGKGSRTAQPNLLHPEAAGLDIGSTEVYAAVRRERDPDPIRNFPTFTVDLHALATWLKECQVTTVAMESTGVYWIPVHQILEAHGFEVVLVNARHVHSVPGRKSDVADCEWLRYLHSVGLLRGSFRPADEVCALRSLMRHRDTLIKTAARSVSHMQKAYSQMNIHLHHAISDLTGVTGMAITDAILAGERDPARLAALADRRIKASRDTLIKALQGDWRAEHLLALRHARATYAHYQQLIAECDAELEAGIRAFEATGEPPGEVADAPQDDETGTEPEPPTTSPATAKRFDLRSHLTHLFGTDLTLIPGIGEARRWSCSPNSARNCPAFRPRRNSLPGCTCVPTTRSLAARSSAHTPVPAAIAPPRRCAGPPSRCTAAHRPWVSTSAACGRASVLLRRPPRPRTNWRASFTI